MALRFTVHDRRRSAHDPCETNGAAVEEDRQAPALQGLSCPADRFRHGRIALLSFLVSRLQGFLPVRDSHPECVAFLNFSVWRPPSAAAHLRSGAEQPTCRVIGRGSPWNPRALRASASQRAAPPAHRPSVIVEPLMLDPRELARRGLDTARTSRRVRRPIRAARLVQRGCPVSTRHGP